MEDMAANLTGDSKGAERRRGGGSTALGRRIELGRAALVGDDGGRRRRSGTAVASRRRNGSRRDDGGAVQIELPKCWRKAEEEGTYIGGPFCLG